MRAEGAMNGKLEIAGRALASRLIVGTGKFSSGDAMRDALAASGTEMVTVALRRVDLDATGGPDILEFIDRDRYLLLPNTSGAIDAAEAVRLARLARAMGLPHWVKLEVTPDPRYLLPDPVETLRAAEVLVADGFTVLPYSSADPVLCKHLEEAGCAAEMARAFRDAVEAGRRAFSAGLAAVRTDAEASSPLTGFLDPIQP